MLIQAVFRSASNTLNCQPVGGSMGQMVSLPPKSTLILPKRHKTTIFVDFCVFHNINTLNRQFYYLKGVATTRINFNLLKTSQIIP